MTVKKEYLRVQTCWVKGVGNANDIFKELGEGPGVRGRAVICCISCESGLAVANKIRHAVDVFKYLDYFQ